MERKELFVTDLAQAFNPSEAISLDKVDNEKWNVTEYETTEYSGKLIYSGYGLRPENISYDPGLTGWYKIYVTLPEYPRNYAYIRLSSDITCVFVTTIYGRPNLHEEQFWRCADMTGESIILTKQHTMRHAYSALSALRFVPMTDEEVEAYKADRARTDRRKMYLHEDMGHYGWSADECTYDEWRSAVTVFGNADTAWVSTEFFGRPDLERFSAVVEEAHALGMKISMANRMGLWGAGFPYHLKCQGMEFADEHPELHCVDRDGTVLSALSYAFPEVRKQRIDEFVIATSHGADAVNILANRGCPYVVLEKPVADRFYEKYGEYPYEYPLDDPRSIETRCEFIEQYLRELRAALDENFGKNKVEIHVWGFNSIEDCKMIGFDVYKLAKEGLLNCVETHTRRFRENTPPEIMRDDDPTRIDMEKYKVFIKDKDHNKSAFLEYDEQIYSQYPNSKGEMVGPTSFGDNVRKWAEFTKETGVPVYHEMRHFFDTAEMAKPYLKEFYENGGEYVAMFNAAQVAHTPAIWDYVGKCGHKDEFMDFEFYPHGHKTLRVLKVNGISTGKRFNPAWN